MRDQVRQRLIEVHATASVPRALIMRCASRRKPLHKAEPGHAVRFRYASIAIVIALMTRLPTTPVSPPPRMAGRPVDDHVMNDLRYPAFPKGALLAAGTALLALMAIAIVVNRSGPSVRACAYAAERVMAARNYSVKMMELHGQASVPACH